jgi:hypothetical protein
MISMFHVPELSRGGPMVHPDRHGTRFDGNNGAFDLESPEPGWRLACAASDGEGWEHVSVHAYNTIRTKQRVPRWMEMCYVKRLFWDGDDVVMQLHPAESDYVNAHPHVLHLWRPTDVAIPTPPAIFVGPPAVERAMP